MPSTDRPNRPRWTAWPELAGFAVGASGGLLLVLAGTLGAIAWALLIVALAAGQHRRARLPGVPVGFGAVLLALLLLAESACRPEDCVGPDLTGWIALAVGCVVVGLGATIALAGGLART